MPLAPIVLFTYNRPRHTSLTLDALSRNDEAKRSELIIFSDGPRQERDLAPVAEVRRLLSKVHGFRSVQVVTGEQNLGLANSIIRGVTQVCASHGCAVVLEDDIVVSSHFLRYVNTALEIYRDDDRVISVGCYTFPVSSMLPETFFFRVPDSWGWAVWQRSWKYFEPDGEKLLAAIKRKGCEREFDLGGSYPFTRMLQHQVIGRHDSWAIRWYATAFLGKRLTVYPGRSVTTNIGMDGSGTHCKATADYDVVMADAPVTVTSIPVEEHPEAYTAIAQFLRRKGGLVRRLYTRLSALVSGAKGVHT